MFTFLFLLTVIVFVVLAVVAGIHPMPHLVSHYELNRRAQTDAAARRQHRREMLLPDVYAALTAMTALLMVLFVLLCLVTFGLVIGIIISLLGVLLYPVMSQWKPINALSYALYTKFEIRYLRFIEKARPIFTVVRATSVPRVEAYHRFDSKEELETMIRQAENVLSQDEQERLVQSLGAYDKPVETIMTVKHNMKTINKTDFLGPLMLSEIHELGHSRLPVIDQDIDHVIGVLSVQDLLSLDVKKSVSAEKAMEAKVYYIRNDETIEYALNAFIHTKQQLFIVINEYRETVGLLTLLDVVGALIGNHLHPHDKDHQNIEQIARTRPIPNNQPAGSVDVSSAD